MSNGLSPGDETTQSFVVRLWQEAPGRWRGSVRHVQSQAQRGISRVGQVSAFMTEQCRASVATAAAYRPARRAAVGRPALGWLGGRRFRLAGMAAALLAVSLTVVLLAREPGAGVLAGAAVAPAISTGLLIFLTGALVGGTAVACWVRLSRRD